VGGAEKFRAVKWNVAKNISSVLDHDAAGGGGVVRDFLFYRQTDREIRAAGKPQSGVKGL
jgi:hypothetical protein